MKRYAFLLFMLAIGVSSASTSRAADIRHTFANSSLNSFYIDDRGGSAVNGGAGLTYYLGYKDVDQSAYGTLLLYSKVSGSPAVIENGFDYSYGPGDFSTPSGIFLRPLSALNVSLTGEIGLGSNSQLLPVTFQGTTSGLRVEQVSYTSAAPSDKWVIIEYRIFNPTAQAVMVKLGLANDFDVQQKSSDDLVGYAATPVPWVYQQQGLPSDPNFTTVGVTLAEGAEAQHRQEICNPASGSCAILANDGDLARKAFFQGDQVGDLTGGVTPGDYAVSIAADLGVLQPGEGKTAVFIYGVGQGPNSVQGLSNTEQTLEGGKTYYETNLKVCGNGLVNFGEQCDDGNQNNQDACPSGTGATCQNARCGDGFTWIGHEECDDGNSNNNDLCTNACKNAVCGDGFTQPGIGEQCDLGAANNDNGACTTLCQNARCGDGFLQPGEVCDDGNNNNGDGCAADCKSIETCGNGTVNAFEQCDDGNQDNHDACPDGAHGTCHLARCGDGFIFNGPGGSEACDDGNSNAGDGCSDTCQVETGWVCSGEPSVCVFTGTPSSPAANNPPPPPPVCGNGIVEKGEECDDGANNGPTGDCSLVCIFNPVLEGGATSSPGPSAKGSCSLTKSESPGASGGAFFPVSLALYGWILLRKRKQAH
ncbi:MAG: DUF4215 domain-containing protein [bacterium]